MSSLSLPSHTFSAVSPWAGSVAFLRTVGSAIRSAFVMVRSGDGARNAQEVLAWANSIRAEHPSLAAELTAMASRDAS